MYALSGRVCACYDKFVHYSSAKTKHCLYEVAKALHSFSFVTKSCFSGLKAQV